MTSTDSYGAYEPATQDSELVPLQSLPSQSQDTPSDHLRPDHARQVSSTSTSSYTISYATSLSSLKRKSTVHDSNENPASIASRGQEPESSKWHSFFRSVGLKSLAYFFRREEMPKVILSDSRRLAGTRTAVHIFPFMITLFLFLFNGLRLLNGPDVTVNAKFWLQVAAKFHELLIVGSLTSVALDLLHHHLLNEGVNLGLLASGLSVASPSWLWSFDFLSGLTTWNQSSRDRTSSGLKWLPTKIFRSKVFLLVLLCFVTVLATVVGPASALLFNPIQLWVRSASTHFYIEGTEESLWPQVLTNDHVGPEVCSKAPIPLGFAGCLNGAWKNLAALITPFRFSPIRPGFALHITGGSAWQVPPAVLIAGNLPTPERDFTWGDPDTWAVAPHLAVTSHADLITHKVGEAFSFSKGINWRRRLRDFGGSHVTIATDSKFPITRTVCGDISFITGPSSEINFPIVQTDRYWHTKEKVSRGPMSKVSFSKLNLSDWDAVKSKATTDQQSRARWIPVPPDLGNGTAALVYLAQNRTATFAYACVLDARWAKGQTMQTDRSILWSWESEPGNISFNRKDSSADYHFQRKQMLDPAYTSSYSQPIHAEQDWLNALAPSMPEASQPGNELVMNSFEALMNISELAQAGFMGNGDRGNSLLLEYITTLFFVNALSRIGLVQQLTLVSDLSIKPSLRPLPITDDSLIAGKPIYPIRDPKTPFVLAHLTQHKYGTAWAMATSAQLLAVAILSAHILIALVHTIVLITLKKTSSAWDSISELVVLAFNSRGAHEVFENCSGGIQSRVTLEKKVRIGARGDGDGGVRAEIVVCDEEEDEQEGGDVERIVAGRKYN